MGTMRDPALRAAVMERLPLEIHRHIRQTINGTLRTHISNIVDACTTHPRGLEHLYSSLKWHEGGSQALRKFHELLESIQGEESHSIDDSSPSLIDEQTITLGSELEDAYRRKRRLEDLGQDASDVIESIVEIKRRLRRGGRLQPGYLLGQGRYLLIKRLGRGGFATVWEAQDQQREMRVAVKVLHSEFSGDSIRRQRFLRGARTMENLQHDAIVRVLEPAGEDDGFYYFVMEHVDGGNLHHAVIDGRVGQERALSLGLVIGDALAYAHGRACIHRDVKPANILLTTDGEAKLTDFDLVDLKDTTGGTRTGAMGTVLYAAPEMWERPQDADERADVYGLAMTMVFALYGAKLPLEVMRDPAKFLERLWAGDRLTTVLKRALEWEPVGRFESVSAFCDALRALLEPPNTTTSELLLSSADELPVTSADGNPQAIDTSVPTHGRVSRRVATVSLLVTISAALAIYMLVIRVPHDSRSAQGGEADASNLEQPDTPDLPGIPNRESILAAANRSVRSFDKRELMAADEQLTALDSPDDPKVVLVHAQVQTALAQHARDAMASAEDKTATSLKQNDADKLVKDALALAKKALANNKMDPSANAIMADLTRLQGKSARHVEHYIKTVRKVDRNSREAALIVALTFVRDRRLKRARPLLMQLERGDGHVAQSRDARPTYRLALLDFQAENYVAARTRVNTILEVFPDHGSATALLERIPAGMAFDTSDPLPPEDGTTSPAGEGSDTGSGMDSDGQSYEALLAKADRKSENGDCKGALRLYEQATVVNAAGIAALIGMGYCHIDRKQFSSAQAKFNSALIVAPNYMDAMWGLAEAYQQQGDKKRAIDAYNKFIKAHAGSRRSDIARRLIERLGGTVISTGSERDSDVARP